jgi:protein involved in polysaccharide export with SLBB domain
MGQSIPLFLTRAAAIFVAGMLLFAVRAHAADGDYGLKRFPGDNYDSVPAGAGIAPPAAPTAYPQAPSSAPAGYYPALNSGVVPQVTVSPPPAAQPQQAYQQPVYQPAPTSPQPYGYAPVAGAAGYQPPPPSTPQPQAYQPAPASPQPYGYAPVAGAPAYQPPPQTYQPAPVASQPYGYKAVGPATPIYPAPRLAAASPARNDPYAYYQQDTGTGARANADYVLGPGDKLHLNVFGEADLSGDFTIDGSGYVRLPLVGQVRAAGYTGQQLEAVIGGTLAQGYLKSPRVAVEVATYRPFYIIGAVNRPGQYPYVDHMNALNAIALAGGYTNTAVESVVFVRREGSNQEVELATDRTTDIRPGDVVKVHNTLFSEAMNFLSPMSGAIIVAASAAVH